MNHAKGIFATIATPVGIVTAWLPAVEAALRISVSAAGLVAAIYAARYWRLRGKALRDQKEKESAE